jgi:pilus assembly protein CpaF
MFSVIISEKGGAERREAFDRTEINVGRVQGNDLMLPKGNVSKRHARLLYRDGRFIVTDLKSTNGTYVNGRKIAQATIVREGDKIYIGDFVLRIDTGSGSTPVPVGVPDEHLAISESSAPPEQAGNTSASMAIAPLVGALGPGFDLGAPAKPSSAPQSPGPIADPPSSTPSSAEKGLKAPAPPRIEPKSGDRHEVISHFPLEHDPDESIHYAVPGPPRVPSSPRPVGGKTLPVPQATGAPTAPPPAPVRTGGGLPPAPGTAAPPSTYDAIPKPSRIVAPPAPEGSPPAYGPSSAAASIPVPDRPTSPSVGLGPLLAGAAAPPARRPPPPVPAPAAASHHGSPEPSTPPPMAAPERTGVDPARAAAHRAALLSLVELTGDKVDLRGLADGAFPDEALAARIDRVLAELAAGMRGQGDLDLDALVVEARRELCAYGPLTPLFDDEDVTEIQVVRHDYVVAMHGRRQVPADVGFTSEHAVNRVLRRLCVASGKPLVDGEPFVERRLSTGGRLFAVLPRMGDLGHMVVIRKPQRADLTLEDLVRSGTISRAMAGLFAQCVAGRANILVTGAVGAGTTTLIGALAAAGSTDDRVVVLQEDDELIFNQPHTISILLGDTPEEGARAVQAATRVRPDRLVVGAFAGTLAAEVVDAMGDGVDGVLAGARAPTLRQAVLRLTADLAATRPGLTPEVAREWLTSVFDLAIEVARLRDGRHRVLRVAELGVEGNRVAIRDVFTFAVERTAAGGAIEGSFYPTGVVPGIIEDLAARGVALDPAIFKRHTKIDNPPAR